MRLCVAQGTDKIFVFHDASSVDYSGATEITFDVWERNGGASLLSLSLTGGRIILADVNKFNLTVTNAESGGMSKGNKYCEAWVTLSTGERRCVGKGSFMVQDTRKFD